MSHHLFLLSPTDTPLYSLTHVSTRPSAPTSSSLSSNLPSWSTSAFAATAAALSGASSSAGERSVNTNTGATRVMGGGVDRQVIMMIANASLDVIEDVMKVNGAMYLKAVDKFNEWTVSAFITPGNMKFVLLHDGKNDDSGIKSFFSELWELYVKTAMNPFHTAHTSIRSPAFDARVRASAKKYL
ncbi:Sedlin [Ceratobasidium sp. AG-I]|nr:Sedlin [Ceratobasidium sp. AG-I]